MLKFYFQLQNQKYILTNNNVLQSFNAWESQVSATDATLKKIFSTHRRSLPSSSVCKPIGELAVWLAAQTYMSCVVPLNGMIDNLRRLMGLMIANTGVKFPSASIPQIEWNGLEFYSDSSAYVIQVGRISRTIRSL